ncbi:MAG TPA: ferritin family protein [bacterium]|nr:ferritin family protein [bacterium]HPN45368.1 ferritin family protein [bacterium]
MYKLNAIDSLEALKMSIQCENDMKEFYSKASTLVKNDDAETILRGLADKEEKNRLKLIKTYGKTSGKKILYLNLGTKHKLSSLIRCCEDPNDAVRIVKKNEKELKNFYMTVSRRLVESELRALFRDLAMEREQHLVLLESSFVEPLQLDQEPVQENPDDMLAQVTVLINKSEE